MANAIPVHKKSPRVDEVAQPAVEVSAEGSTNFLPMLAQEGDLGGEKSKSEVAVDVPMAAKEDGSVPIFSHRATRLDH